MTSARFWQILPPPDDVSICQTPPFQSDKFFKEPPALIETLMFILSSLKLNFVVILGEYINAVVSRIV